MISDTPSKFSFFVDLKFLRNEEEHLLPPSFCAGFSPCVNHRQVSVCNANFQPT